jgi:hypothetical protein
VVRAGKATIGCITVQPEITLRADGWHCHWQSDDQDPWQSAVLHVQPVDRTRARCRLLTEVHRKRVYCLEVEVTAMLTLGRSATAVRTAQQLHGRARPLIFQLLPCERST